jgi:hypothetical protein
LKDFKIQNFLEVNLKIFDFFFVNFIKSKFVSKANILKFRIFMVIWSYFPFFNMNTISKDFPSNETFQQINFSLKFEKDKVRFSV